MADEEQGGQSIEGTSRQGIGTRSRRQRLRAEEEESAADITHTDQPTHLDDAGIEMENVADGKADRRGARRKDDKADKSKSRYAAEKNENKDNEKEPTDAKAAINGPLKILEPVTPMSKLGIGDRCAVCTLPYGTCTHTKKKLGGVLNDTQRRKMMSPMTETEQDIDDVLGFIGDGVKVEVQETVELFDINAMSWMVSDYRLSDKIETTSIALSAPKERGWHSVTNIGDKYLVLFGGITYKQGQVPQPFTAVHKQEDVSYMDRTIIFDMDYASWHTSKTSREEFVNPLPRYGHAATAIDENRMLIFGGRGCNGGYLCDTWIFDVTTDAWSQVELGIDKGLGLFPNPRVFASCMKQDNRIFLFGGTDGTQNMCDIWIFQIDFLRWERAIAVGPPPSPRYGHRMVRVDDHRIAVLGGCSVCPFSEVSSGGVSGGLMGMGIEGTIALFDLQNRLENNYKAEGSMISMGGDLLESTLSRSTSDLLSTTNRDKTVRSLLHSSSMLAGQVAELEHQTRETELRLVTAWQQTQANMRNNSRKARHPLPHMDITFLDTTDLVWKEPAKLNRANKSNPDTPCSRIHFAATSVGGYIIVTGGLHPTCLKNIIIDTDTGDEGLRVHVLDPNSLRWVVSRPKQTAQYLDVPLSIAEADIIRAKQRVEAEKFRGLSLGALNGQTIELAEAQAILAVCEWRKEALLKEKEQTRPAPTPSWGMNGFELVRQRAYMLGGWDSAGSVDMSGGLVMLDFEIESERIRRMADEFASKLELEQRVADEKAKLNKFLSAGELRMLKEKERRRERHERRLMRIQDILSSLPPLSKPKQVAYVKSNDHTIWVSWERATTKADGEPINPKEVTYMLYAKSEYQNLIKGDKVLVTPLADAIRAEELRKDKMNSTRLQSLSTKGAFSPSGVHASENWAALAHHGNTLNETKLFPGELLNNGVKGFFHVAFDDGTFEKKVHRKRIRLDPMYYPSATTLSVNELEKTVVRGQKAALVTKRHKNRAIAWEKKMQRLAKYNPALLTKHHHHHHHHHHHGHHHHHHHHNHREHHHGQNHSNPSPQQLPGQQQSQATSPLAINATGLGVTSQLSPSHGQLSSTASVSRAVKSPVLGSPATNSATTITSAVDDKEEEDESSSSSASSDSDPDVETMRPKSAEELEEEETEADIDALVGVRNDMEQRITFLPGPEWKLLYVGNGNDYACTGIVPDVVLLHEPKLTVTVSFMLQTQGLEFPGFERSQFSDIAEYSTCRAVWNEDGTYTRVFHESIDIIAEETEEQSADAKESDNNSVNSKMSRVSSSTSMSMLSSMISPSPSPVPPATPQQITGSKHSNQHQNRQQQHENAYTSIGLLNGAQLQDNAVLSRRKKEFIAAKLSEQNIITIEKQYNHAQSSGTNDHYL